LLMYFVYLLTKVDIVWWDGCTLAIDPHYT
jgi:hypothetical protein